MSATTKAKPAQVERDVVAIWRAVGRLARHLGDEDQATVAKAARALEEVGPFAVGPLAAALPRARSARHRLAIIGALVTFGDQAKLPIVWALNGVLVHEKDPRVRAGAQLAMRTLLLGDLVETVAVAQATDGPARRSSTGPG